MNRREFAKGMIAIPFAMKFLATDIEAATKHDITTEEGRKRLDKYLFDTANEIIGKHEIPVEIASGLVMDFAPIKLIIPEKLQYVQHSFKQYICSMPIINQHDLDEFVMGWERSIQAIREESNKEMTIFWRHKPESGEVLDFDTQITRYLISARLTVRTA